MRRIRLVFALAILSLFFSPFHVVAKGSDGEIHTGRWNGGPYYMDDGYFTHCFISADYKSGIRILFILTRDYNFSMNFIRPGWNLTPGQKYAVKYWVDQYEARNGTAVAKNSDGAIMDLEDTKALFEEMRRGYELKVRTANQDFLFNLKDTYRALRDLKICVDSTSSGRANYEDGTKAWQSGDFSTAHQIFRPLAEQGNAKSQFSLGLLYHRGHGVPKDLIEALKWVRRAAEQNNLDAQYFLGSMYAFGEGIQKDFVEAAKWYRLAAGQGHALGQLGLGLSYQSGNGVGLDYAEAMKWYHKAAAQGNSIAQSNLGIMYSKGQGVSKDYIQAYFWASLAANQGLKNAIDGQKMLAKVLTPDQILEAKKRIREWQQKPSKKAQAPQQPSSTPALPKQDSHTILTSSKNVAKTLPTTPIDVRFRTSKTRPDDIAVIIGNADYEKGRDIPNVIPAYADAEGIKRYVKQALGIREDNIIFLKDSSQAELTATFGSETNPKGQLSNYVKPGKSRVFVYYSGHGAPGSEEGSSYLVPSNAQASLIELNGYPLKTLYENLSKLPAKSVTVVLEACFSGASQSGSLVSKASPIYLKVKETNVPANISVIAAGAANQIASWEQDSSSGLFTKYFLKGMSGEADAKPYGNGDGKVGYDELGRYFKDTLTYYARRYYGREQTPQIVVGSGG